MYILEQGDQSSIANFWTKISDIFRGTVGIFLEMSKCVFIYWHFVAESVTNFCITIGLREYSLENSAI